MFYVWLLNARRAYAEEVAAPRIASDVEDHRGNRLLPCRGAQGQCCLVSCPHLCGLLVLQLFHEQQESARGVRSIDQLEAQEVLGEGAQSTVALCVCKHSALRLAVKMYHKSRMTAADFQQVRGTTAPSASCGAFCSSGMRLLTPCVTLEQAEREISAQAALQCEHVVALYAAFEDEEGVYLVQARAAQEACWSIAYPRDRFVFACSAVRC